MLTIEIFAAIGAARGEVRRAAQLKGFADAQARASNRTRLSPYDRVYGALCAALESGLTADSRAALKAQGAQLTLHETLEIALHIAPQPDLRASQIREKKVVILAGAVGLNAVA